MFNPYTRLPRVPVVRGRHEFVVERCRGRRVLHVGCVDSGLLEERYRAGELMHLRLSAVAAEVWGVDNDAEGIAFLQARGVPNLFHADAGAFSQHEALRGQVFDVIVATELIEHLANPGSFLEDVRALLQPGHTQLIVTVPNAFRIDTLLWMLRGIEFVHPDHNYWFSYSTLTHLLQKHQLQVNEVLVYSFYTGLRLNSTAPKIRQPAASLQRSRQQLASRPAYLGRKALATLLTSMNSFWGDGLIAVAGLADQGGMRG